MPLSRQRQPIYEVLAQQNGIHLPRAESRQQEGQRRVVHAMRDATEVLSAEMAVREARWSAGVHHAAVAFFAAPCILSTRRKSALLHLLPFRCYVTHKALT